MGDWAFGCDICQDVCPWNRKAPVSHEPAFAREEKGDRVLLSELLAMTDAEFHRRHGDTPLARPGRDALAANACIAAANSGDARQLPVIEQARHDRSELVRQTAAWAERRLHERLTGSAGADDGAVCPDSERRS
jgi:epoxyqueuosine reductase